MGSYLELLRASRASPGRKPRGGHPDTAAREGPEPRHREDGSRTVLPFPDAEASRLTAAGYRPEESFSGRVIWERPDTGFYVSKEMALHLLDTNNVRSKSGADEGR